MSSLTYYAQNKTLDALFRGQALGAPGTIYFALIRATRGKSNSVRGALVSSGDTIIPATPNGHMYRCTTGGTTGVGEPSWNTTSGSTTNDGTAVWTEMTPDFLAGTNLTEVPTGGTGYARVGVTASLAEFAGTQGPGTTTPSSGTTGKTSNNNVITFGAPIADWGVIAFGMTYDAVSGGNPWTAQPLTNVKTVNDGDSAPTIAATDFNETLT